ncbi:hypothetical protein FKM82_024163 [Ascaphus truei]
MVTLGQTVAVIVVTHGDVRTDCGCNCGYTW